MQVFLKDSRLWFPQTAAFVHLVFSILLITASVTATTNRTIAVDPTVIPYGSKVVINGQVYVAEDCGGAIKNNRIDIYMGSHAEALNSGVFDVEVYLLEEGSSVQGIEGIQEGNQE